MEQLSALIIDEELDPIAPNDCIARLLRIEQHFVLQAGAPAFRNLNSEAFAGRLGLLLQERSEMLRGAVGHIDHEQREVTATLKCGQTGGGLEAN